MFWYWFDELMMMIECEHTNDETVEIWIHAPFTIGQLIHFTNEGWVM